MQIVSNTDEGEPLFKKLRDTRGAEQEQAEDHAVLGGRFDEGLSRGAEFRRGVHVGKLVLLVKPHRHAQVVLPEEENIDARYGGDFNDILDARGSLDLQRHDDVLVGLADVTKEAGLIGATLRKIYGTGAGRGVAGTADGLPGFIR